MVAERLRVTIVSLHYAPEHSGNAPYVTALARGLADRGHEVHVVTSYPFYPEWSVRPGYEGRGMSSIDVGVKVSRFRPWLGRRGSSISRFATELHAGWRSLRLIGDTDVVLYVSPALLQVATLQALSPRLRRLPSVLWVQDLYSLGVRETGGSRGLAWALTLVEGMTSRGMTRVVTIHERFTRYLSSVLHVSDEALDTVRNWTHVDAASTATVSREDLGWASDELVVLHAGNQGAKQGLDNVIEAARLTDDRGLRVRFVLLGDGNQRPRLENAARGVKTVEFRDAVPDELFMPMLRAADVLLVNELPGLQEMSVPSKLTSYAVAGRPIVSATNLTSVTADETRRMGGTVVPAGDPEELLAALTSLQLNPERRSRLASAAASFSDTHLRADRAIDAHEAVLRRGAGLSDWQRI